MKYGLHFHSFKLSKVTNMADKVVYHIIKKNVEGAYLLDKKNSLLYSGTDLVNTTKEFINLLSDKLFGNLEYALSRANRVSFTVSFAIIIE